MWKWAFIDQASAEPHAGTLRHWNGDRCFLFHTEKWMWKFFFLSAISLGKSYFIFPANKLFFVFHDPETAKTISTASTNASWMWPLESGSKGGWERKNRGSRGFVQSSSNIHWLNALSFVSAFASWWIFRHCFLWLLGNACFCLRRPMPRSVSWAGHWWKSM